MTVNRRPGGIQDITRRARTGDALAAAAPNPSRRTLIGWIGAGAATLGLPAGTANAFLPWLLRFLFSRLIMRNLGRRVVTNVIRGAARNTARGAAGAAATSVASKAARGAAAKAAARALVAKKARTSLLSRATRVNYGVGSKPVLGLSTSKVRKFVVEEIAIDLGMRMIMPESRDFVSDEIIGISVARADEIDQHEAQALWISDEVNEVSLEGRNLLSERVIDVLFVELYDIDSGELLDTKERLLRIDPNSEFTVGPFQYKNVPVGPKRLEAYLRQTPTVVFREKSAAIVVVAPHEVIKAE